MNTTKRTIPEKKNAMAIRLPCSLAAIFASSMLASAPGSCPIPEMCRVMKPREYFEAKYAAARLINIMNIIIGSPFNLEPMILDNIPVEITKAKKPRPIAAR